MSWKINKDVGRFAASNSIHTHSLVTANFTLTDNYVGDFGVIGNVRSSGYIRAVPTIYLTPIGYIDSGNVLLGYNLSDSPYITGISTNEYKGIIFNTTQPENSPTAILRVGINVNVPSATLHILGNIANSLILSTSGDINTNILASNASGSKISLGVSNTNQTITMTNIELTPIASTITHSVSGNLSISVANKCMVSPQFGVSPSSVLSDAINTNIGTASFYAVGSSDGTALYSSAEYDSGNTTTVSKCASIIAADAESIATIDLLAPTYTTTLARGMGFAGGKYVVDNGDNISRSMGAFGLYSVAGEFVPSQTTVAGTSTVKLRSTLGINTITPRIDECILDVNGPVIIDSAQIKSVHVSSTTTAELFAIPISSNGKVVAAGYTLPTNSSTYVGGTTYFITSSDSGETWTNETNFTYNGAHLALIDICVYSANTIVACGSGNSLFIATLSENWKWMRITLTGDSAQSVASATSMSIVDIVVGDTTTSVVLFAREKINLTYFTFTGGAAFAVSNIIEYASINTSDNFISFDDISSYVSTFSNYAPEISNYAPETITRITKNAFTNTDGNKCILCAGTSGITVISVSIDSLAVKLTQLVFVSTSYISLSTYTAASTNLLFSVFVATGYIISTNDGGNTYTITTSAKGSSNPDDDSVNLSGLNFVDVKTSTNTRAVAITAQFEVFYTVDAGITWTKIPNAQLNAGGDLTKATENITTVASIELTTEDANTIFITTLTKSANQHTANIYNGYLPNAVNFNNHTVLKVYGNTFIAGDITVTGIARITSNTDSSSVDNGTLVVKGGAGITGNINVGGIVNVLNTEDVDYADSKYTAALCVAGGVYVAKQMVVSGTFSAKGIINIYGITTFESEENSTNYDNGALVVKGGAGIAGNINVNGIVNVLNTKDVDYADSTYTAALCVSGGVYVAKQMVVSGITTIENDTESTANNSGALVVKGGAGIAGNVNIGKNLYITSNINSTTSTNGALVITGGLGISQDVYAGGKINAASFNSTSDLRYKTDFEELPYGINTVMQLHPLTYAFKDFNIDHRHIGLIAQDVAELVPEVVSAAPDGTLSIAYMELIPVLIKAIQQQTDSITALRARVEELENARNLF
jgi:hypothetical protein